MWKFTHFALASFLVISGNATAASMQTLKLELSVANDALRVTILNISTKQISVNARFADGRKGDPTEINFEIRDLKGRSYPFANSIRIFPAAQADWSTISPRDIVGRDFPLSEIAERYGLRKREYIIKARYNSVP